MENYNGEWYAVFFLSIAFGDLGVLENSAAIKDMCLFPNTVLWG